MSKQRGFTLVELVVVIVILAILAVAASAKFLSLQDEAKASVFYSTAASFKTGVQHVHLIWQMRGNGQAVKNLIPISDPLAGGDLSVNEHGYPADTRGVSLTLNSQDDCLDVWRAVLDSLDVPVAKDLKASYRAEYLRQNDCRYTYVTLPQYQIYYNSNTGEVRITP
ncbi:hypothetical protein VST7929_03207 [Vibrio stylophorae]|uniref:Prepilin-type N-terminal cleavage/methylation domain-containing protein n=1 Tax=Vibrio stylophorae TaxID=659351 RepID=A0ABM8ZYB2_9VIBR|nr:prepilin-type N-terminal cleavage/methylation domain-containing protein [Vibrio stylophorae]CAH0535733.1 hypothetical protein VST7929_03207 [Vibrio stylophorae]